MLRSAREERRKSCVFHCFTAFSSVFFGFFSLFFFFIHSFDDLRRCCATTAPKSKTPSYQRERAPTSCYQSQQRVPVTEQVLIWSYTIYTSCGAKEESSAV